MLKGLHARTFKDITWQINNSPSPIAMPKDKKKRGVMVRPRQVRVSVPVQTQSGGSRSRIRTITPNLSAKLRDEAQKTLTEHYNALPAEGRLAFNKLRDIPDPVPTVQAEDDWDDLGPAGLDDLQDALNGDGLMESGAGGEFRDTLEEVMRREREQAQKKKRYPNTRNRRRRVEQLANLFEGQLEAMTNSYVSWSLAIRGSLDKEPPNPDPKEVQKEFLIIVVDVFRTYTACVPICFNDKFTNCSLVARGLIPCAPWNPKLVFSIRLLELFRVTRLRTPSLSIQGWMKTIAELHGTAFKPYSAQQFSIGYDAYCALLEKADSRVMKALSRDELNWRRKNCCPGCMYKLEGEEELESSMLVTMDGNDSLKRVLRREPKDFDNDGNLVPGQSKERFDPRAANVGKDYFIPREKVDLWSKDKLDEWRKEPNGADKNGPETSVPSESTPAAQPTPEAPAGAAAGCEERWKNLGEDSLKRMWGIYDETGIFICLCRHGFVLLVEDMVRSGELSKYALAACAELLEDFDGAVGSGYDVGCGFAGTLFNSPLGAKALLKKFMFLVGAFHGHAHNRLCQLIYLATYVLGLGLEDLEGCERFFSKSNAMAASIRYASVFHRRQILASYFKHFDTNETYANLSKFLVDNYWQALEILEGEPALYLGMKAAGIDDVTEFPRRLEAEFTFLKSLMADSEEDTLHMEYYQRLVNLADRRLKLELTKCKDSTASATVRRHAQENFDKAWIEVQETEVRMGVKERWLDTSPEWAEAAHLVSTKRYRLALLKLERLVVQRMFELTKMNLSQTGYKLRKHIAKALQVRSQAIRNALNSYNTAAKSIVPAGRQLSWSEVIEYAFLADFDLLRKPAELGEVRPWSTPAARLLLDKYFKIQRAREEIRRCNIEIRRVITSIRDEKAFLTAKENELQESDPGLAWCIRRYRFRRERYDLVHMERFQKLAKQAGSGFTGTLEPGVRLRQVIPEPSGMEGVVETGRQEEEIQAQALAREMEAVGASEDEEDDDDDVGGEEEDSKLAEELHTIFIVSEDDPVPLSP
ncbi:hypothetical protein C8F04DRAFT_1252201 [Mycena alexandri]|uniref:CxC1-like cysteine cluster associated with KDZ transposases domain-containing protein n=1 Tax=Mycena alexandri TaxID=1745969 RepID=A0AAD6TAU9_9AGAR|nr:hypothetical protein C8F04DRAFT_1252201 [Mycena alexandri]